MALDVLSSFKWKIDVEFCAFFLALKEMIIGVFLLEL